MASQTVDQVIPLGITLVDVTNPTLGQHSLAKRYPVQDVAGISWLTRFAYRLAGRFARRKKARRKKAPRTKKGTPAGVPVLIKL